MCAILTLCTCENVWDTCLFSVLNVSHVALSDQYEYYVKPQHIPVGLFFFFFFFEIEWFAMRKLVLLSYCPCY